MKLSDLLASRSALLRQAALANAAHAYSTFAGIDRRIRRARLRGAVRLSGLSQACAPHLLALTGSQAVIEEHFDDVDLVRLADALGFVAGADTPEFEFRLEALMDIYGHALRDELRAAGVDLEDAAPLDAAERPGEP